MLSKVKGVRERVGGYLKNVCAVRAWVHDSLGRVILTSGLYVYADVTAALRILDIVNKLFEVQMPCFLTIWSIVRCMVFQTGMV